MRFVFILLRPLKRMIDRRIDTYAVRRYHRAAYREMRLLAIEERDPRIAKFFEAQARAHRRFAGPLSDLEIIDH